MNEPILLRILVNSSKLYSQFEIQNRIVNDSDNYNKIRRWQ